MTVNAKRSRLQYYYFTVFEGNWELHASGVVEHCRERERERDRDREREREGGREGKGEREIVTFITYIRNVFILVLSCQFGINTPPMSTNFIWCRYVPCNEIHTGMPFFATLPFDFCPPFAPVLSERRVQGKISYKKEARGEHEDLNQSTVGRLSKQHNQSIVGRLSRQHNQSRVGRLSRQQNLK